MKRLFITLAAAACIAIPQGPALAITDGSPDGNGHPVPMNVPGATGDFSMLLSNNTNTGGTCFGDSGGPNFLGGSNLVAGVTSFGKNGTCGGTGGVFRLDRQNVLDFINGFIARPYSN